MKVLITGTAGFIGYHLAIELLKRGDEVVGLDSINDYYDPNLKMNRLRQLGIEAPNKPNTVVQSKFYSNHRFIQMNLEDQSALMEFFKQENLTGYAIWQHRQGCVTA